MSIVDGKGLIVWEGCLFEPGSDLLRRVQWVFGKIRADGGTIILNEAGRPFGVETDKNARTESQTASGCSTVWFQWGRYLRGETPSAADPRFGNVYASEHTKGLAVDCNAPTQHDAELRAKYMAQVGMEQTISSESWHWAIRGPVDPGVSLASVGGVAPISNSGTTAAPPEEDYSMTQGTYYQLVAGATPIGSIKPGDIFFQASHGEPILRISYQEWTAAHLNHNELLPCNTQNLSALIEQVGAYSLDAFGRRVPAGPKDAQFGGYKIYLPR